ncbi:MAG: extracellular solute-binding protein [Lachnospiraceae bacterium]|nr:extracellular solute-binding protein [Lachnospiraceae bacterium]
MKMKQVLSLVLCGAMVVSVLTGCGGNGGSGSTGNSGESQTASAGEKTSDSGEDVTLRFAWWGGDARHEATLAVIEAFEKEHPNIHIEAEYSSYDGYSEKKTTEFASETAPDIFQIETGLGPEYYKNGVLYNLSETSIDWSNFDENFLIQNGQFGSGSQYAIPTGQAGSAIIVNKTLADEIGIDFTQQYDWNQLLDWGKQVQEYDPECYLISANTSYATAFIIRTWCRQMNAKPIIDDDLNLNMTEEQFTECFTFIKSLYDNKVCAPASYKAPFGDQDQEDPNWIAGKYVCSLGYTSAVDVLSAANDTVEYIAGNMPIMADAVSDGWFNDCPQYIGMYAKTKHPEEAAMFLDYFYNSDEAAKILGTVRSVPPTAKAQAICEESGTLNALTKQSVETSMQYNGVSDGGKTTSSEVTAILNDAYDNVSYGEMEPAEAAAEVVALLTDYIEMNK